MQLLLAATAQLVGCKESDEDHSAPAAEPPPVVAEAGDGPVAGVYRLDAKAALEAIEAATEAGDAAQARKELGGGRAWLVLDPADQSLLLHGVAGEERLFVEALQMTRRGSTFELTQAEHANRGKAACSAKSDVRLECEVTLSGGKLTRPLPVAFDRTVEERDGLPRPGIYVWQEPPTRSEADEARVQAMRESLGKNLGLSPEQAKRLSDEMWRKPSLHLVEGDEALIVSYSISVPSGNPSEAELERTVMPPAKLATTEDGFRIEIAVAGAAGPIVLQCQLGEGSYRCRDPQGIEYEYARR